MNRLSITKYLAWIAVAAVLTILWLSLRNSASPEKLTASTPGMSNAPGTQMPVSFSRNADVVSAVRLRPASAPTTQKFIRAFEVVRAETDDLKREKELEKLADTVTKEDFAGIMQVLRDEGDQQVSQGLSIRILRRWAAQDPRTAASWLLEQPGGLSSKQQAINTIATIWASQDLSAGLGWVNTLPEEKHRDAGILAIAYEIARTSPVDALNFAAKLNPNDASDELILHAARQWAATAPRDAATWAGQMAASPLQQRVLAGIATDWAKTDAEAAANFAVKSLEPGKFQDDAVVGIVQRWVQSDPEKAAAWVTQFPEGIMRDAALENLVKLWADKDPSQLGHWLNTLEASLSRDLAIGVFVNKLALVAPTSAAHWVENISDDTLRLDNMEKLGEGWIMRDPTSARAWISASPLPEATKARLLALQSRKQ